LSGKLMNTTGCLTLAQGRIYMLGVPGLTI